MNIELCSSLSALLEFVAQLPKRRGLDPCLRHAGNIDELQVADVIDGDGAFRSSSRGEQAFISGDGGGRGELVSRLRQAIEQARAAERRIVVAFEPDAFFVGGIPIVQETVEVFGLDVKQSVVRKQRRQIGVRGYYLRDDPDDGAQCKDPGCRPEEKLLHGWSSEKVDLA